MVTSAPHDEYGFVTPTEFKHHNFQELEDQLQLLASNYPNITRLYYIGSSVKGRKLYVMEISDKPGIHEPGEFFNWSHPDVFHSILKRIWYVKNTTIIYCLIYKPGY